jgi:hypothetical protein
LEVRTNVNASSESTAPSGGLTAMDKSMGDTACLALETRLDLEATRSATWLGVGSQLLEGAHFMRSC